MDSLERVMASIVFAVIVTLSTLAVLQYCSHWEQDTDAE